MDLLEQLRAFAQTPEARGLEDSIRTGEGTAGPDGYRTLFGGQLFNDFSRHPDKVIRSGGYASAAAGAGQFMPDTWNRVASRLGLQDFSPESQRLAMFALARERLLPIGGLAALKSEGLSPRVAAKLAPEWASFPTESGKSYYGQPVKSLQELQAAYQRGAARSGSGATAAAGASPSRPSSGGQDDWMDAITSSMFKTSPMQGMDAGAGMTMSRGSGIDPSDPLKTLANVSLQMAGARKAGAKDTYESLQRVQSDIAGLARATERSPRQFTDADLLLPEERQPNRSDPAIPAIRTLFSDKASGGSSPEPALATSGGQMEASTGARAAKLLQAASTQVGMFAGDSERCADAIREFYKGAGIPIGTTKQPWDGLETGPRMASSFFGSDVGEKIKDRRDLRPGDLVGFQQTYGSWGPGVQTHVGLYAGNGKMYDHSSSKGVVLRDMEQTFPGKFMFGVRPYALMK